MAADVLKEATGVVLAVGDDSRGRPHAVLKLEGRQRLRWTWCGDAAEGRHELVRLYRYGGRVRIIVAPGVPRCGRYFGADDLRCTLPTEHEGACDMFSRHAPGESDGPARRPVAAQLTSALNALRDEAEMLDQWARQSEEGGWSTHQVQAQRLRADVLRRLVATLEKSGGTGR